MVDRAVGILWDWDGTIVDTEPLFLRATEQVLSQIGCQLSREAFRSYCLAEGQPSLLPPVSTVYPPLDHEELTRRRDDLFATLVRQHAQVRPGVSSVLERLSRRSRMAIVTGSERPVVLNALERLRLTQCFAAVVTAEGYARPKPAPDGYLAALRELDLSPECACVVEDSVRGVRSARRAGLRCIAFPTELTFAVELDEADAICSTAEDVHDRLSRWISSG